MDGYAFAGVSLAGSSNTVDLALAGTALAGRPFPAAPDAGQCVRIMTGASMPPGCDTVVPQELVARDGDMIRFDRAKIRAGQNRRLSGKDLAKGKPALLAGRILRASDLGLLASLGIGEVPVRKSLHRGVLFHRRRIAFGRRNTDSRQPLRQQPLHPLRHAYATGRGDDRSGHRARRPRVARKGAAPCDRMRGCRHQLGRRVCRRCGLHAQPDELARRRRLLEDRDAPGPAARLRPALVGRARARANPRSSSACRAIRSP